MKSQSPPVATGGLSSLYNLEANRLPPHAETTMSTEPEYRPGLEDVPAAKSAVSFTQSEPSKSQLQAVTTC